ncbi:hypothetical protein [Streptacidiphilus jiangxiensis]|uniref:Uncharacterized protein n=1 Tax=Streptacidiphilus jiangxiensis TaxID=235985 RepID=A0A1H7H2H0_STRJI|nr:hypothetical protein [Streptacidiphilus jiangxiensis]SEK44499.1 hypothetical protein SAMN05414137_10251 [Streptacidiphilus jiangxiensis]
MTATDLPRRTEETRTRVIPRRSVRHPDGSPVGLTGLAMAGLSPEAAVALVARLRAERDTGD